MMSHGLIIPEGPLYAIFGHKPATASPARVAGIPGRGLGGERKRKPGFRRLN